MFCADSSVTGIDGQEWLSEHSVGMWLLSEVEVTGLG